jgi:hypothetical protein
VPGQAFYVRQLVFMRVKQFMVESGVRNNDFGIVARGNKYFGHSKAATSSDAVKEHVVSEMPRSESTGLTLWTTLCATMGAVTYVFVDQWVALSLVGRIIAKYVLHKEYLSG